MFVDASALAAVLLKESDRERFLARMEGVEGLSTSVVSVFEAMLAIGRETGDRAGALGAVRELLEGFDIGISPIDGDLLDSLEDAYLRYGKGSGHPARLNLGDCFTYAMAKRAGVPLLYKGGDFALTDLV